MKVEALTEYGFEPLCLPEPDREITGVYIGDLLSWVMGRAKSGDAWLTIMSNINMKSVYSKLMIIKSFEKYQTQNSHSKKECIYFYDNAFILAIDLLEMEMQFPEYINMVNENASLFRSVALKGCIANIFYKDITKIIKSLLILISPKLYHFIAIHN